MRATEVLKVLVVGAGGHGVVVADVVREHRDALHRFSVIGFVDDVRTMTETDVPILGTLDAIRRIPHDLLIVAIGRNEIRCRLFERFGAAGHRFCAAIHRTAWVAHGVEVEEGSVIAAGVVINPLARVGANVIVNTGARLDHHCSIGAHAHIAPGVTMGGHVTVGEGACVGIGATVLPGRTIGSWSMVGAGAVVTKDVPDGVTVVGTPARVMAAPYV